MWAMRTIEHSHKPGKIFKCPLRLTIRVRRHRRTPAEKELERSLDADQTRMKGQATIRGQSSDPLDCMALTVDQATQRIFGGVGRGVRIWDLVTGETLYKLSSLIHFSHWQSQQHSQQLMPLSNRSGVGDSCLCPSFFHFKNRI